MGSSPLFGIRSPGVRVVVWLVACAVSSACVAVFWPLGVLPFVVLALISVVVTKERGRPWG